MSLHYVCCMNSVIGCVKKREPQNPFFYLWFLIAKGPKIKELFSETILEIICLPFFAMQICTKNGQINITKLAKSLKGHKTSSKGPNKLFIGPREAEWSVLVKRVLSSGIWASQIICCIFIKNILVTQKFDVFYHNIYPHIFLLQKEEDTCLRNTLWHLAGDCGFSSCVILAQSQNLLHDYIYAYKPHL